MKRVRGIAKSSVIKSLIASIVAVSFSPLLAPIAQAQPVCTHRSAEHAAKQHTTREGDSRWHVAHGQLPTCNLDKSNDRDDSDSGDDAPTRIPRRDHHGFHCTWHGCG